MVSGQHSMFTHFVKNRNCDICLRTKITRASCRKRTGTVVPTAKIFGDNITADPQILSEGCESRNNHRHPVVVQDLATQWLQSYPCKTKTSHEITLCHIQLLKPWFRQREKEDSMPTRRESQSRCLLVWKKTGCNNQRVIHMLVISSSVRMLTEIHHTTSNVRPAISFHLVLAGIVTSFQD